MDAMRRDADRLLQRFAAGDADAFVAFYRLHLPAVLGWFQRRTGDAEVTADLAAETFCAALLAAPRFRPDKGSAVSWLYGIAGHKLADSRRHGVVEARARRRLALVPLRLEDEDVAYVERLAPLDSLELELGPELDEALRAIPGPQRDAVVARVVEERPYGEIAERMQCSELVVRQRVARGLRALRGELGEQG
jgi:RNA polymerase sigma factor (sigma-70 family)